MRIITRAEWGARPPKTTPRRITIPTPELWLHHTASPTGYAARIRAIQNFHMDTRGWNDIAYSYLINHDGIIYEGRGAGIAGGHTQGHNTISHAVCLLGDFDQAQPTIPALEATVELVRHGVARGWWPDQFTGGHRDASGADTSCPGDNLHMRIPEINQAINPQGDDDMLTARLMVVEAGAKTWLPDQASIDYWMVRADNLDNPEYADEWRRDFEQMWALKKQDEWKKLLGHPHGATPPGLTETQVRELASSEILRRLSNG